MSLSHPQIRTKSGHVVPMYFAARAPARSMRAPGGFGAKKMGPRKSGGPKAMNPVKMPFRLIKGVGQVATTPSVGLPSCGTDTATNTGQIVLGVGGGLAMVVGIIGAVVSDTYREDFAIAAGAGLVASFIGAAWAVGSAASCAASAVQTAAANAPPMLAGIQTDYAAPGGYATTQGGVQLPSVGPSGAPIGI